MLRKKITFILLIAVSLCLGSCAGYDPIYFPTATRTVTHIVAPGETLWRIGQIYNVEVDSILLANNLDTKTPLRLGQTLIIPRAHTPKQKIPLFNSSKWEYIIIHHSATDQGNSLSFHHSHLERGWDNGVGYHFVINNGLNDKADGFIEITPRWLKQLDGAHCKADNMNVRAIGINLVGNFNKTKPTTKQVRSLTHLVDQLRKHYNIPIRNILGHGEVTGSSTECPGSNFSIAEFRKKL